jgi:hypothetical protein
MERSPKKRRSTANKAPKADRLADLQPTKAGSRELDSATTARIKGGAGTAKSQTNDINTGLKVAIDL